MIGVVVWWRGSVVVCSVVAWWRGGAVVCSAVVRWCVVWWRDGGAVVLWRGGAVVSVTPSPAAVICMWLWIKASAKLLPLPLTLHLVFCHYLLNDDPQVIKEFPVFSAHPSASCYVKEGPTQHSVGTLSI